MEHSTYKEMLSALLDGELSGAEREAVLAHMVGCADCRAYFHELTALHTTLGALEEFDTPEGFAAGVMARVRAESETARVRDGDMTARIRDKSETAQVRDKSATKPRKKRTVSRRYAALAACAAVVLLAVYALPNALRMGGNQSAAPAGASGASSEPDAAPEAPGFGYSYAYTNGANEAAGGAALESLRTDAYDEAAEGGTVSEDAPADADNGADDGKKYSSAATTDANEKLPIANGGEEPMEPLIRPEAWGEEYPVLTLSGRGAEDWLAGHGWQGESGAWYAEAAVLRALPETLTVLYSELTEDYDGAVRVELGEAEP